MNNQDSLSEPEAPGGIEQDRIVTLSDGVFAIAITLLVLDIRVPNEVNITDVYEILFSLLPHFIGYTISFIVIASYWLGHRTIMKAITHIDRNFLWLTLRRAFTYGNDSSKLGHLPSPAFIEDHIYSCYRLQVVYQFWLLMASGIISDSETQICLDTDSLCLSGSLKPDCAAKRYSADG